MAVEKVKAFFARRSMEGRVRELGESSATVALAAQALGCDENRIAKTLSFMADGAALLVVASGDMKVDNQKFKAQFGIKAKMLSPSETEELVGHAVGGVCPFAVNDGVRVYLDESLRRFDTVFPACGSANSVIELTVAELEECSGSICWVDVCKTR